MEETKQIKTYEQYYMASFLPCISLEEASCFCLEFESRAFYTSSKTPFVTNPTNIFRTGTRGLSVASSEFVNLHLDCQVVLSRYRPAAVLALATDFLTIVCDCEQDFTRLRLSQRDLAIFAFWRDQLQVDTGFFCFVPSVNV